MSYHNDPNFRPMQPGEIIQEGDERYTSAGWEPATRIGDTVNAGGLSYRRRLKDGEMTPAMVEAMLRSGQAQIVPLPPADAFLGALSKQAQLDAENIECHSCRANLLKLAGLLNQCVQIMEGMKKDHE